MEVSFFYEIQHCTELLFKINYSPNKKTVRVGEMSFKIQTQLQEVKFLANIKASNYFG
jgi:hypothetical protein